MFRVLAHPLTYVALLCACGGATQSTGVEPQLEVLRAKDAALHERLEKLERQAEVRDQQRSLERVIALLPSDTGYSTMKFDVGVLVVSLADVQPFANGSRIKLVFGNPTSARVQGLKLKLEWGGKEIKTREHTLTETLLPGSWVNVTIPLDGVPPDQFTGLRLTYLGHQGIFLNGRKDA